MPKSNMHKIRATNLNELIDECHEQGNTSYIGVTHHNAVVAMRTRRRGAHWHYYDQTERGYVLRSTSQELRI